MNNDMHKQIMADNIKRYMEKKGVTNQQLCDALDFKYTTFLDWIKAVTYPRMGKVEAMANYFGCEKSDLIEEKPLTNEDEGLTKSQLELMEFARGLSEREAEQVLQTMKLLVQGLRK